MGVGLTHSTSAEKNYRSRSYTPADDAHLVLERSGRPIAPTAGEERDSDKRTMGGVNALDSMVSTSMIGAAEILALGPIPPIPPAAGGTGLRRRTMGVGSRNSTLPVKKFRFRSSTPSAGEERDSDKRTKGVGLTSKLLKNVDISRKNTAPGPIPPAPARNGTPVKGRWGWADGDHRHGAPGEMSAPKNSRCKSYTPSYLPVKTACASPRTP
jgi:hypothetical protein